MTALKRACRKEALFRPAPPGQPLEKPGADDLYLSLATLWRGFTFAPNHTWWGGRHRRVERLTLPMAKTEAKSEMKNGAKMPTRMYKNRVALPDDVKKQVVEEMSKTLAASLDMYSQAKFAHWNVKGLNFYQLHLVFDDTAKTIFKQIDKIAERFILIGGIAIGTVWYSSATSEIPPYNVDAISGPEHLEALANALGTYCALLRDVSDKVDEIGDSPTSDFYNQLIVDSEEELYFLESHMEAGDVQ